MTPPKFVVYLTCLLLANIARVATQKFSSHHQEGHFVSANVGENVTLQCFYKDTDATKFYWYKQSLGQKPKFISMLYKSDTIGTFSNESEKNPRFTLDTEAGNNRLHITDLRTSDSATYYCARRVVLDFEFAEGIVVSVKGSGLNFQALVQQSASQIIQRGGSVTLNCTVHTGTCDGEHRVYWFKTEEESHPGLIYTHGGSDYQCEKTPNTKTQTCVYNLPVKIPNASYAGTYYCAVASCGRILFGNGTKLNTDDEVNFVAHFWKGAFTFTSFLSVLLAFSVCLLNKKNSCKSPESQAKLLSSPTADAKDHQHGEKICYAALSVNLVNRSESQRDHTWSDCVYYNIKQ